MDQNLKNTTKAENNKSNPSSGFFDIFLSKVKEQSFLIILMLGIIYYQHRMMEERVGFWQRQFEQEDLYIKQMEKEQREDLLQRIEYLQNQRDKYTEEIINTK
jgi:hypothetical protein